MMLIERATEAEPCASSVSTEGESPPGLLDDGRRLLVMSVDLPSEVLRRLTAEADRRGVDPEELLADVAEGFLGEARSARQAEGLLKITGIAPGVGSACSRVEDWPE